MLCSQLPRLSFAGDDANGAATPDVSVDLCYSTRLRQPGGKLSAAPFPGSFFGIDAGPLTAPADCSSGMGSKMPRVQRDRIEYIKINTELTGKIEGGQRGVNEFVQTMIELRKTGRVFFDLSSVFSSKGAKP